MSVTNAPSTYKVFEYCFNYRIKLSETQAWSSAAGSADPAHPLTAHIPNTPGIDLIIPSFQRGIQWNFDTLNECINSDSSVNGIAVLGQLNNTPPNDRWLLDGLQRFTCFTWLLFTLDDFLFGVGATDPNVSNNGNYINLRNSAQIYSGYRGVIRYNYNALSHHNRGLISSSVQAWNARSIDLLLRLVDQNNVHYELAKTLVFVEKLNGFLNKPLFIENLVGFNNIPELVSTFVGLNTVRVELGPQDVVRSSLVDSVTKAGGTSAQATQLDNDFNSFFLTPVKGAVKRPYPPLIESLNSPNSTAVFPSTAANPLVAQNIISEFGQLIDWLTLVEAQQGVNSYWDLLYQLGTNPYIATVMYYFHINRVNNTSGQLPSDIELHQICRAYSRLWLDGGIGDTLKLTKQTAWGKHGNLQSFIAGILGNCPPLASALQKSWLLSRLDNIKSKEGAKVAFNSCQLPICFGVNAQPAGTTFSIIPFGNRSGSGWDVDHLIPQASFPAPTRPNLAFSMGDASKDTLRNFFPLIYQDNRAWQNTSCANKFNSNPGLIIKYLQPGDLLRQVGGASAVYIDALYAKQSIGNNGLQLEYDNRDYLVSISPNNRGYGQERIELLADLLIDRL